MKNYNKMPIVELEDFQLRTILKKDAHDFYEFGKDQDTTSFLTWGPFKTIKEAKQMIKFTYMRRLGRREPIGYAIIDKSNEKMVGTIEFHSFNHKQKSCEIGYVLSKAYWNKGIMTRCVIKMTEVAFAYLDMDKVIIKHVKENIASRKVILKAGYKQTDILKRSFFHPKTQQFHDVYLYEITRRTI